MPSHKAGWEMDFQAYVPPLLLYQIRMSPNSVIDLHDHRHHNGALCVREGTVRVRSFDIYEEAGEAKWDVAAGKVPEMRRHPGDIHFSTGTDYGMRAISIRAVNRARGEFPTVTCKRSSQSISNVMAI